MKNKILFKLAIFYIAIGFLVSYSAPALAQVDPSTGLTMRPLKDIINSMINWLLGISTGLAVLFLVYGGVQYVTAAGDDSQTGDAKKIITYAILGLIVIGMSFVIVKAVSSVIG